MRKRPLACDPRKDSTYHAHEPDVGVFASSITCCLAMKYLLSRALFSNLSASLCLFAIRTRINLLPVSATAAQCKLDCAAGGTASESVLGGSWSIWETQRLVGPTEPSTEQNATYPHARASFPLPFPSFCQLGCSFFFAGSPRNTTCKGRCDQYYASNVSVGISDFAQKV